MEIYKEALMRKLRFKSSVGNISTEDLFSLPLEELDSIAKNLHKQKENTTISFVKKQTDKSKLIELMFNVVLDVINTKLEEQEKAKKAAEEKARKQKILEIIESKEMEDLKKLPLDELKKLVS